MALLQVWICTTNCPRCGKTSRTVLRRSLSRAKGAPRPAVVDTECLACQLAPLRGPQRDYYLCQWRQLWAQAGGLPGDMPDCIRPSNVVPTARAAVPINQLPVVPRKAAPTTSPPTWRTDSRAEALQAPAPQGRVKAVVVLHELSLTGAPIIMANLLPHLRGMDLTVYSPTAGPLLERFHAQGIRVTQSLDLAGCELVIANTLLATSGVEAARSAGLPCVWLIHEFLPETCGNEAQVREVIGYPDVVIFAHESTAANYAHLRKDRVRVIPSIVPPVPIKDREEERAYFGLRPHDFFVITMGRKEGRKGQEDLEEATQDLPVKVAYVHDEPSPWDYYAAADLYVCTSRQESFPLSLQEAKAYSLPVITTDLPGCLAICQPGVHAWTYKPGDVRDLREILRILLAQPGSRRELTRKADHLPTFQESVGLYEEVFLAAAGRGVASPLHVVWHIAGMGSLWRSIVLEQLHQLKAAGLTNVLATHVGEGLDEVLREARAVGVQLTVCEHLDDVAVAERPAIELIQRLVKASDKPVLYLHTKGVSHADPGAMYHRWRQLMMHALVARWREHLPALHEHDAVGVNWWAAPTVQHFSGNFWMARASWLQRLPPIGKVWQDRYSAERWIGMIPGASVKSLLCVNLRFWDQDRAEFEKLWQEGPGKHVS